MKTEIVPIDSVKTLSRNPRKHPPQQIRELEKSIESFGQYRPLVVDEKGEVLVGNGLLMALRQLGHKKVSILRKNNLTEQQKKKLVLADNRLAALGSDDYDLIDELLKELDDFEVPGYDAELLREILASADEALTYAADYGKLPQEEIERTQQRAERMVEYDAAAEATVGNPPEPFIFDDSALASSVQPGEPTSTENPSQRTVTCPACSHVFEPVL